MPALLVILLLSIGCERRVTRDLEPAAAPSSSGPADARGWYLEARVRERREDFTGAEYAYAWAVRLDRANPDVHLGYARFLLRQERPVEALAALEEAARRAPGDPDVHLAVGDAWAAAGDAERALGSWWAAGEAGAPDGWQRLATAKLADGDRDGAIAAWERWRAAPLEGSAAVARGRAGAALGREAEAVDDLVLGVRGFASSPEDGALLVEVATRSCRLGTAWAWAHDQRLAARGDPAWDAVAARLREAAPCPSAGLLEEARGAPPGAGLTVLERALDADPTSPEVLDALRSAYDEAGMMDAARRIDARRHWSALLGAR